MFHFIFSCYDHVISNSCDTFHANEDGIQFGFEKCLVPQLYPLVIKSIGICQMVVPCK